VFAAGTASANTWPKLTTGTLLTTPEAGAIEYASGIPYITPNATSNRSVLGSILFTCCDADFTGTNGTAVQPCFTAAQDRLTVTASTTYLFEMMLALNHGATTTTLALAFDGGTCSYTSIRYWATSAVNVAINATGTAQSTIMVDTAAVTVISATGTGTTKWVLVKGVMRINASGTMLPQYKFSADPTGTILTKKDSYMILTPVGSNTVASVGAWA
jgi:hypothetical protein